MLIAVRKEFVPTYKGGLYVIIDLKIFDGVPGFQQFEKTVPDQRWEIAGIDHSRYATAGLGTGLLDR